MRHRGVPAFAHHLDRNHIGRGHERTFAAGEHAAGNIRRDVHRKRPIRFRMPIDQTILDHPQSTKVTLLAGLEHELHCPRKLGPVLMQQLHRPRQHRRMRIVPASVHAPRLFRLERHIRVFRHRQRIHVAAQQNRAPLRRPGQRHDHARRRRPLFNLHVEPRQRLAHGRRRLGQMQPKLRKLMYLPPQNHRIRQLRLRTCHPSLSVVHVMRPYLSAVMPPSTANVCPVM